MRVNRSFSCCICYAQQEAGAISFGKQPISNRYLNHGEQKQAEYLLELSICYSCAAIQLLSPVSYDEITPSYDWLKYNEPEEHLDLLVEFLQNQYLNQLKSDALVVGVSYKDESFLARLQKQGYKNCYTLNLADDFKIKNYQQVGVEAVQHYLTRDFAQDFISRHGQANVIVARHILEHAHQPIKFMQSLLDMTKINGYLIIEIPNEQRALELAEAMVAWEEHVVYFTPETFKHFFDRFNCKLHDTLSYAYPFEDSLVAIVQNVPAQKLNVLSDKVRVKELVRFDYFIEKVTVMKKQILKKFEELNQKGQHMAVLGAGHLSTKFINFYNIAQYIDFVIDDNPYKQGYLMPGSKLEIVPSENLLGKEINLCLIGANPNVENAIIEKNKAFIDNGGVMSSIFQGSPRNFLENECL